MPSKEKFDSYCDNKGTWWLFAKCLESKLDFCSLLGPDFLASVINLSEKYGTSIQGIIMMLATLTGCLMGPDTEIYVGDWSLATNIYCIISAPPISGKSACLANLVYPILDGIEQATGRSLLLTIGTGAGLGKRLTHLKGHGILVCDEIGKKLERLLSSESNLNSDIIGLIQNAHCGLRYERCLASGVSSISKPVLSILGMTQPIAGMKLLATLRMHGDALERKFLYVCTSSDDRYDYNFPQSVEERTLVPENSANSFQAAIEAMMLRIYVKHQQSKIIYAFEHDAVDYVASIKSRLRMQKHEALLSLRSASCPDDAVPWSYEFLENASERTIETAVRFAGIFMALISEFSNFRLKQNYDQPTYRISKDLFELCFKMSSNYHQQAAAMFRRLDEREYDQRRIITALPQISPSAILGRTLLCEGRIVTRSQLFRLFKNTSVNGCAVLEAWHNAVTKYHNKAIGTLGFVRLLNSQTLSFVKAWPGIVNVAALGDYGITLKDYCSSYYASTTCAIHSGPNGLSQTQDFLQTLYAKVGLTESELDLNQECSCDYAIQNLLGK